MPAMVKVLMRSNQLGGHQGQGEEAKEEVSLGDATVDGDSIIAPAPLSL